jgi:hypothetical protein
MKQLALIWKDLPVEEKAVYETMAEADKARFVCFNFAPIL